MKTSPEGCKKLITTYFGFGANDHIFEFDYLIVDTGSVTTFDSVVRTTFTFALMYIFSIIRLR